MSKFGYTSLEWEMIWSNLFENGAWDVPAFRDSEGNFLKENFGPEMLIRFAAYDIKCHIVVIDLKLSRIQFCSGNFLRDNNVVFESPLILYATGNHFQSVFQNNHGYWIQFTKEQEQEINPVADREKSNVGSGSPEMLATIGDTIEPREVNQG